MSEAATGEHLPAIDSLIYCVFLLVVIWEIAINITKKNKERKKTKDEVEYSEVAEKNWSIMKKKKVVKFSCQTEIRRKNKNEPNSLPDIIFFI